MIIEKIEINFFTYNEKKSKFKVWEKDNAKTLSFSVRLQCK